MDKLESPQAFSFDSNVSHSWKLWLKHFDFYLAVTEKDTKGDKIKTSIFLTFFSIFSLFKKEEKCCNPRKKITILWHRFFTYRQQEGQNCN